MSATIRPAPVRRSVTVKASPARAFDVFTTGIDKWWPHSHHVGASPMKQPIIEPRVGGRWYALCEDGSRQDIGSVLEWDRPARVLLAWNIDGRFQYDPDMTTEIEVTFTPLADGSTRVDLEHRHLERMGDMALPARARLESPDGWGALLALYAGAAKA